jgi:hypothetical protein
MIPSNPFGIEILYNATTCLKMCQTATLPDFETYQKLVIILAVLVIGLAVLLLIKGKKNAIS